MIWRYGRSMRRLLPTLPILAALALLPALSASAAEPPAITWLGHATFEIVSPGGQKIIIDPFLVNNPSTPADKKKLADLKPNIILVSHSHADHASDAVELAKLSKAKLVGAYDWVGVQAVPDDQKSGGNVGGKMVFGDVTVHLVPAMHGSDPGGRPLGFIIEMGAHKIYFSGDTWIFGDMALIQEIYAPTVLLLQAGGGPFNQDPATAALAVKKYFKPKTIIPMHFGTWPILADEAAVAAAFKGDKRLKILKPGETFNL